MAPRFAGTPVEPEQVKKPRFAGTPMDAPADAPEASVENISAPTETYDEGYVAQGLSGVNEGIAGVLGFPVDAANAALRAGAAGINAVTGSDIQLPVDAIGGSASIRGAMAGAIKAPTDDPSKQIVRRIGEEVGASLVPGIAVAGRAARPIQSAVTQGAVALGSGTAAGVAQQVAPDNPYVEVAAQILGGATAGGALKGVQKAVTPFTISPQRAAMNQTMANEGVELSAGQMTGSKSLQNLEGELAGGAMADLSERQLEQFTQAALSRAGISADRASPEVMDDAFTTIGREFDDLAARNQVVPDQQFSQDLATTVNEYNSLVPESARAPVVENLISDIVQAVRTGPIPGAGPRTLTTGAVPGVISGDAYQSLRSRLNRMARKSADPQLQDALFGIQHSLDDAMERSIQAHNPSDAGAWQQVRTEYRNLVALETAASRAGENTALGLITPANLRSAVAKQNSRAYVRGQGDFADLARSGVATMTPPPNSGTASRQAARALGMGIPTVVGAALGGQSGALGSVVGATAGAATPYLFGKAVMSNPGRRYLTNQLWNAPIEVRQSALGSIASAGANSLEDTRGTPNPGLIRALRTQGLN